VAIASTKETRVEEKQKEFLCPLSWSIHHNLACDGYIESTCFCVQTRFLGMETRNTLSLGMVYSASFNNVLKALNLFLNKYVAEIHLPGFSQELTISLKFLGIILRGLRLEVSLWIS
jgi:hypothetical protein